MAIWVRWDAHAEQAALDDIAALLVAAHAAGARTGAQLVTLINGINTIVLALPEAGRSAGTVSFSPPPPPAPPPPPPSPPPPPGP